MSLRNSASKSTNEILNEFSPEAYRKAIHDSWNSCILLFGSAPQFKLRETKHLTTMACSVKFSMLNRVFRTRLSHDDVDEKIRETIEYFSSKGLPFRWQIDPGDTPEDLPERLENHGLTLKGGPGMALVIDELRALELPEGFTFEKVVTRETNEVYCRLLPEAYGMPDIARDIFIKIMLNLGVRDDFCNYLGFLGDEPVSASSVFYSDGVAGIYNVATLPRARGRGIGTYMTAAPLFDARDLGYRVSILHSTRMGYNVYKRLGYEEYCRHESYEWIPESQRM